IKPSIERNRLAITLSNLGRRGRKSFGSHDRVDRIIARESLSRKHDPRQAKQIYALRRRPCGGENAVANAQPFLRRAFRSIDNPVERRIVSATPRLRNSSLCQRYYPGTRTFSARRSHSRSTAAAARVPNRAHRRAPELRAVRYESGRSCWERLDERLRDHCPVTNR